MCRDGGHRAGDTTTAGRAPITEYDSCTEEALLLLGLSQSYPTKADVMGLDESWWLESW
jgi:hypothetical protein